MSASLIGHSRSSAFRLSAAAVSMSLTGSCFSSESAPRPFHHVIRGRGGAIYAAAFTVEERQFQADMRTHLIHRPARDTIPPLGGNSSFLLLDLILHGFHAAAAACFRVQRNSVPSTHNSQPARQGHNRLFHPAAPGNLHRPGLEPAPFLRTQHALSCFVEHDPHHLISAARYSTAPID